MRIAQLAANVESVPPSGYGGTNLVVSLLTNALVEAGHEVTLFATGDSKTKAKLVSEHDCALRFDKSVKVKDWPAYELRSLIKLEHMQDSFDIVHNHMGYQALPLLDRLKIPTVTTNHDAIKSYCAPIYLRYGHLPYVALSEAFKKLNHPEKLNYQAVIYNGINVSEFLSEEDETARARKYLLFVGRICRDNGTMEAIEIARKLALPLIIAGKLEEADEPYFHTYVEPYLEPGKIDFIGEVDYGKKLVLYQGAIAVLYPIAYEETFGTVMAEAMASGTPVLALDRGSVREVLVDGKTAVIGNSVGDLISRFGEIARIDPKECRLRAVELFSVEKMMAGYERLYHSLVKGHVPAR
ncbi:MAG: glycosyltransferase family 4 protein [Cyanobacteria bacterium SZAS LIN-3]|nr:glycosyltransferase family 4 protein [Cyanobacteria bacterium SZAS LIN-3]MBS2008089.1 glycosyltransferase family 4 protein [Cyanobacteria bacterium SZAS TMP-1]